MGDGLRWVTCRAEDVNSFQGRRLIGADQIPSRSLHLLQLHRPLGELVLQQLRTEDTILVKITSFL